ncbi:MAG: cysteine synthase A [Deltaproteobacteria bacterium]|nr:cysteine synthase A [Deltaproteobacteria bacterium]
MADSVLSLVGATPLVRLHRVVAEDSAEVLAKLESKNPGGSVKDRAALAMMVDAERSGALRPGVSTIIEATSGNTGISLAMIAAVRGYRCVLVMPEDMSIARRQLLRAYGAELIQTSALEGMQGAVAHALALVSNTKHAWMSRQFENPANPATHEATTGPEILRQCGGRLDAFVAGVGTGGTLTGVARALRSALPNVLIVAVEPSHSAVLSGGTPGLHGIQGLGAGFVPPVLDRSLIDRVITVSDVAADRMATRLARTEGLLVGTSAGANVHAACALAETLGKHARVVTILCDTGERYLF